ncbi:unnamed protein product, partial [Brassica rapa subsp. trilocularis]
TLHIRFQYLTLTLLVDSTREVCFAQSIEKVVGVEDVVVDTALETVVDMGEVVVEDVRKDTVEMYTVEVRRDSHLKSSSSLPLQKK